METPLSKLTMKLICFQILALTVEVIFKLTPGEVQFGPALKVAHSGGSELTENTLTP